jgi:hypothetical protein
VGGELGSNASGWGPVSSSCKHGNKHFWLRTNQISCSAERLSASQEGVLSTRLVGYEVIWNSGGEVILS